METINETSSDKALFVKTFIKAWVIQTAKINELLESLPEKDLLNEIAPGRNSGIYILGHLTAVNDGILPLLGFGERLYPHFVRLFITTPDKSGLEFPEVHELKKYWNNVNEHLIQHFNQLAPEEWLTKHSAVSAEDFAKEPHRNKLNVVLSRIAHLGYHHGQLVLLKRKENSK